MSKQIFGNDFQSPQPRRYQVRDREGQKGIWTRIGSVWPHSTARASISSSNRAPRWPRHPPHRSEKKD